MPQQHDDSDGGVPKQELYHNFILRKEKELREENETSKQSKQSDITRNESNEEGSS